VPATNGNCVSSQTPAQAIDL